MLARPCPFCSSGIIPSRGLDNIWQHAENVHTCIIGDLAIADLTARNTRRTDDALRRAYGVLQGAKVLIRGAGYDATELEKVEREVEAARK